MASRTVSCGCACTSDGMPCVFSRSTSATVASLVVRRKPKSAIQSSLKIFDR